VYVTRRLAPEVVGALAELFEIVVNDEEWPPPRTELLAQASGKDGLLTMTNDAVDEELLDAAGPQLRVVANHGVGFDNVDLEAATERGVLVTNTPGVLTRATAELTIAILLDLVRRVSEGDRLVRAGTPWTWSPTFMVGAGLQGKTLGIVGLGRIGRDVAKLGEAFGMLVVYTSRNEVPECGYTCLPLRELLSVADVVSLHCPLTAETRHLIDTDTLRAMKSTAVLVNTTRGAVVDEAALAEALRLGEIAGAALDVYEREPEVHRGLLDLENVVLAPHLGSGTHEARVAMGMLCVEGLRAVLFESRPPANALNPYVLAART
jgi:glyoxylate reductase